MDADDIDEALSDLGVSSIQSSPPAEEIADVSNNANRSSVALVASSANVNPFPATFLKIGTSARLSRDRLPCDSPIEATTPF